MPTNRAPARIYLGDTGSLFVGFTLAGLGLMGSYGAAVRNSAKRARSSPPACNPFSTLEADVEGEENMTFFEELPMNGMTRLHLIGFFKTKVKRAYGNLCLRQYLHNQRQGPLIHEGNRPQAPWPRFG